MSREGEMYLQDPDYMSDNSTITTKPL